jgi:D-tyrosyl-tRNA(Tyr) deacylase
MKVVVQKVKYSKLWIKSKLVCSIDKGLVVLLGFKFLDDETLFEWFANKLVNLRIFNDDTGKMNLSVKDISGSLMIISNFTLYGDVRKGFRPSYSSAMDPTSAKLLFDKFVDYLYKSYPNINIQTGVFGEMMEVELLNDGPVTIIIEKSNAENSEIIKN